MKVSAHRADQAGTAILMMHVPDSGVSLRPQASPNHHGVLDPSRPIPVKKRLLANALVSLVSGLCFAGGFAVFLWGLGALEKTSSSEEDESEYVQLPPGVAVANQALVAGSQTLRVRGELKNTGDQSWSYLDLTMVVRAGGAEVNRCDHTVRSTLRSRASLSFEMTCAGVSGSGLPDNVTYEISVNSAHREPAGK